MVASAPVGCGVFTSGAEEGRCELVALTCRWLQLLVLFIATALAACALGSPDLRRTTARALAGRRWWLVL